MLWAPEQRQRRENARDAPGGTELISFRAGAGGAGVWTALSRDGGAGRCHCSFGEPSPNPASPAQVGATSELSIHLANTVCPTLVVYVRPCHTQPTHPAEALPASPPHRQLLRLLLQTSLKFLKGPQSSRKQPLSSVCPVTLAKLPQPQHKRRLISICIVALIVQPEPWHQQWPNLGLKGCFN